MVAGAAALRFCLPCDRFLSHVRHCRWFFFCCCGCVQRCNRGMVDGSAQRCALSACSCICRERGFVRWGSNNKCVVVQGRRGLFIVECVLSGCGCCSIAFLFAVRPLPLTCAPLQMVLLILWMCTTVQQGHGRRLSSAFRAIGLQLHLSGTWLCSLGVKQAVRWDAEREGGRVGCYNVFIVECVLSGCGCCSIAVLFAVRPLPLTCAPLQVVLILLLWMCTTVQQGHGRRLGSALRAISLQLHLSGTWLCSLGVTQHPTLILLLWMCTTVQQGHGRRLGSEWRAIGLPLHLSGTWLCSLGVTQQVCCCAREKGVIYC